MRPWPPGSSTRCIASSCRPTRRWRPRSARVYPVAGHPVRPRARRGGHLRAGRDVRHRRALDRRSDRAPRRPAPARAGPGPGRRQPAGRGVRHHNGMTGAGPLAHAAAELYAADLDEFTARRAELASAARAAGDQDAARQIAGLRKPTRAAWLVNQLVRADPGVPGRLAELGTELRAAAAALDGARIRELSQARRRLVDDLVRESLRAVRPAAVRRGRAGGADRHLRRGGGRPGGGPAAGRRDPGPRGAARRPGRPAAGAGAPARGRG